MQPFVIVRSLLELRVPDAGDQCFYQQHTQTDIQLGVIADVEIQKAVIRVQGAVGKGTDVDLRRIKRREKLLLHLLAEILTRCIKMMCGEADVDKLTFGLPIQQK